jgi:hypothetical protein
MGRSSYLLQSGESAAVDGMGTRDPDELAIPRYPDGIIVVCPLLSLLSLEVLGGSFPR